MLSANRTHWQIWNILCNWWPSFVSSRDIESLAWIKAVEHLEELKSPAVSSIRSERTIRTMLTSNKGQFAHSLIHSMHACTSTAWPLQIDDLTAVVGKCTQYHLNFCSWWTVVITSLLVSIFNISSVTLQSSQPGLRVPPNGHSWVAWSERIECLCWIKTNGQAWSGATQSMTGWS